MTPQLFAVLLGGRTPGSTIEQHNVFFGVGAALEDLYPAIKQFWSVAPKIHIDAYVVIDQLGDYDVTLVKKGEHAHEEGRPKIFFVNLGGYQEGVFEEMHKKLFVVAVDEVEAMAIAKRDPFFSDSTSSPHIDDRHALDEFEDDAPVDVGALVEPQGFHVRLEKVRSGSTAYPPTVITGFHRVP